MGKNDVSRSAVTDLRRLYEKMTELKKVIGCIAAGLGLILFVLLRAVFAAHARRIIRYEEIMDEEERRLWGGDR